MRLTDKELNRRYRITKPGSVKHLMYGLILIARWGVTLKEIK